MDASWHFQNDHLYKSLKIPSQRRDEDVCRNIGFGHHRVIKIQMNQNFWVYVVSKGLGIYVGFECYSKVFPGLT